FGLAALTVVVAGYNQQGQENERTNVLLPIGRRETAWKVAAGVLGSRPSQLNADTLTPRPHRALVKNVVLVALSVGVAGAVATMVVGITGVLVFLLLPLGWMAQYLGYKVAGHGIDADYVIVRSGALVTTTSIVPRTNLQHFQLSWSALQESFELATVRLHIPRSVPRARDMDRREAARWFSLLGKPAEEA
ncbi:MAG: PH domain-containing protein, partial [Actinobacteria bacterium]|nr:PH domain-containing protein [Actinomycetota bacterium]